MQRRREHRRPHDNGRALREQPGKRNGHREQQRPPRGAPGLPPQQEGRDPEGELRHVARQEALRPRQQGVGRARRAKGGERRPPAAQQRPEQRRRDEVELPLQRQAPGRVEDRVIRHRQHRTRHRRVQQREVREQVLRQPRLAALEDGDEEVVVRVVEGQAGVDALQRGQQRRRGQQADQIDRVEAQRAPQHEDRVALAGRDDQVGDNEAAADDERVHRVRAGDEHPERAPPALAQTGGGDRVAEQDPERENPAHPLERREARQWRGGGVRRHCASASTSAR